MGHFLDLKPDQRKQILATFLIQLDVFHYDKILMLAFDETSRVKSLIQSDKKKYKSLKLKKTDLKAEKVIFMRNLNSASPLYAICEAFGVQALFSIRPDEESLAFLAIASQIPTFTDRHIETARFICEYISKMLRTDSLVQNLQHYSERMQKMVDELGTLHEITHALESTDSIDSLLEYIMQKSLAVMQSESASLMLVIEETNELEFKVTLGPKAPAVKPFRLPIGQGISGWVAQTGQPVLIPDCYSDPRFDPSFDKRSGYKTRSMLCVPMIHKGKIVGVMSIMNRLDLKPFDENDQLLFTIFASQAALSIENARLVRAVIEKQRLDKELQVASEIQRLLIPQEIPQQKFLEIAAAYMPCKQIGGDFYDFIQLDDHRFVFIVADVSGKGIPGAMVVSNMQATLRAYLEYSADLISIVTRLNEAIIRQTTSDRYITFFIALYDHSNTSLTYINAGHNPPLLITKDGQMTELRKGGVFIGYVPWEYESQTLPFNPGDLLLLYTDGVVEAMNQKEEEFEFKRLKDIIIANHHCSVEVIKEKIFSAVKHHIGSMPLEDDYTMMIARRI